MTDAPGLIVIIAMMIGFACGAACIWIAQPYCCRLEPEHKCDKCGR